MTMMTRSFSRSGSDLFRTSLLVRPYRTIIASLPVGASALLVGGAAAVFCYTADMNTKQYLYHATTTNPATTMMEAVKSEKQPSYTNQKLEALRARTLLLANYGIPQHRPVQPDFDRLLREQQEKTGRPLFEQANEDRDEDEEWEEADLLPDSRPWPVNPPTESQMHTIRRQTHLDGCWSMKSSSSDSKSNQLSSSPRCQDLIFQLASSLVFGNVDPPAGLGHFMILASSSSTSPHVIKAMVAAGVTLAEGIGVIANVRQGIQYLKNAAALGSGQAYYELGCVYYTGVKGHLDAEPVKALEYFKVAAKQYHHPAASYMVANCLFQQQRQGQGQGMSETKNNNNNNNAFAARAFLTKAAEAGHYYARQQLREMSSSTKEK